MTPVLADHKHHKGAEPAAAFPRSYSQPMLSCLEETLEGEASSERETLASSARKGQDSH